MFKKILLLTVIALFCLGNTKAFAEDVDENEFTQPSSDVGNEQSEISDAQMGVPIMRGPGCPQGSADAVLSADKKTLSILFDEFGILAEDGDPTKRLQTSCELVLPFKVPDGMTVSVVRLDYRGYNFIAEPKANIVYRASYFINGLKKNGKKTKLSRSKKRFMGPLDDEFFISTRIRNKQKWSDCGKDFDFHIRNEIIVRRGKTQSEVEAIIDSIDGFATSAVSYHLNWKKCPAKGKRPGKIKKKKKNRAQKQAQKARKMKKRQKLKEKRRLQREERRRRIQDQASDLI